MYSRSLVFAQFFLIGLMAVLSSDLLCSPAGLTVTVSGAVFGIWTTRYNTLGNFNIRPELKEGCTLVMHGPYRMVRHPMYTSVILMALGMAIGTPIILEWISLVMLTLVLILKANREEALWSCHDEAYEAYKRRTKRFIPFIY